MLDGRVSSNENRIPETIQRELDRRRIGDRWAITRNRIKEWSIKNANETYSHQYNKHRKQFASKQLVG